MQTTLRYTVGTSIKLLSSLALYPFSRLARHRLSHAFEALNFPFYGKNYVELSELIEDNDLMVRVEPLKSNKHNTTEFELVAICAIIKDKKCNHIFEIGTFDGRTTRAMALNLLDSDGKIFTLNLPPETETVNLITSSVDVDLASKVVSGERFLNTAEERQIVQLWGDSATFDFEPYYGKMDLVFIDGAHSEDYVANDTDKALQLITSDGGWILWHDAPLFGVVKFFRRWMRRQKLPVYFIKGTTLAAAYVKNHKLSNWNENTTGA